MVPLERVENWPVLLAQWVDDHRATPFEWGVWDCCSAAADWVRVCTGVDLFAPYAGRYSTAMEAARIVREEGGAVEGLGGLVEQILGGWVHPNAAQRGDLVHVTIEGRVSIAVCLGNIAAGPGDAGLVFAPRESWSAAWKVGP